MALLLPLTGVLAAAPAAAYTEAPEAYARYQPEDGCRARPMPGTRRLATWMDRTFTGGTPVASMRPCDRSTSEHQDGRAIDWSMDASRRADRREVKRFLRTLFVADSDGHRHALARRMGVMYVIWNDSMWSAYPSKGADSFQRRSYGCACGSVTTRHRDHVHVSLGRPGARAVTSWYTQTP